jgi:Mrp family chromosome partitioning ATPase
MARLADGVILVVRASSTRVDEVIATEKYLREDGGTLVGTVLNDVPYGTNPYYAQYAPPAVWFAAKNPGDLNAD